MSLLPAAISAGDESTADEVLPRPPAQGEGTSVWSWSWSWAPPTVSSPSGEARGDDVDEGMEPASVERGGDAGRLGCADRVRETDRGLRLRFPVLLRRLLLTGEGGDLAAVVRALSIVDDPPPEGGEGGGVQVLVTFLAEESGSAASDRDRRLVGRRCGPLS